MEKGIRLVLSLVCGTVTALSLIAIIPRDSLVEFLMGAFWTYVFLKLFNE